MAKATAACLRIPSWSAADSSHCPLPFWSLSNLRPCSAASLGCSRPALAPEPHQAYLFPVDPCFLKRALKLTFSRRPPLISPHLPHTPATHQHLEGTWVKTHKAGNLRCSQQTKEVLLILLEDPAPAFSLSFF